MTSYWILSIFRRPLIKRILPSVSSDFGASNDFDGAIGLSFLLASLNPPNELSLQNNPIK
jgi:hypothetical protein